MAVKWLDLSLHEAEADGRDIATLDSINNVKIGLGESP